MRPVNLIPPEQRRGDRAPLRTGPASYAVLAVLAVILAGVTMVVLTNNSIADRESRKTQLVADKAAAEQRARELAPYAEFASMQQARRATVASLAQSRFDWERVLRELAIVLPSDVWLIQLTGTVAPEVQLEEGADLETRDTVPGPALEIVGCGANHESVARMVAALEDIDGVTRVGVEESKRPDLSATEGTETETTSTDKSECRTRDFIARFEIVIAFDAAPVPGSAATVPGAPAPEGEQAPDDGTVPETADAQEQARDSATAEADDAKQATQIVSGAGR